MTASVDLGVWRTPLEPAPRLAELIGLHSDDLWIKRDDWLGLGGGGNKLRKLEPLCAHALAQGATTLLTTGAAQSNHARLTAAAARRLGLDVVLVLAGDGAGEHGGNLTLDGLFDAEIRWAGELAREQLDHRAEEVAEELRARGERPALIPYGGSNALGASGYLTCAHELLEQAPDLLHVVVAVGSGATMAGLLAGLGPERVLGVDAGAVPDARARVARLVADLGREQASVERRAAPPAQSHVAPELRLSSAEIGAGYEQLTDRALQAMCDAARCEALVLDPVYTAKAMAGLAAAVGAGEIRPGERTVFVHTGGLPGLFAHPVADRLSAIATVGGLTRQDRLA